MVDMWLNHAQALDDYVMDVLLNFQHGSISMTLLNMVKNRLIASLASLVISRAIILDIVLRFFVYCVISEMHE
jgi:hypothetical protein